MSVAKNLFLSMFLLLVNGLSGQSHCFYADSDFHMIKVDSSDVKFLTQAYADIIGSISQSFDEDLVLIEVEKTIGKQRTFLTAIIISNNQGVVKRLVYNDSILISEEECYLETYASRDVDVLHSQLEFGLYEIYLTRSKEKLFDKAYLVLENTQIILQVYAGGVNLQDMPSSSRSVAINGVALFEMFFSAR